MRDQSTPSASSSQQTKKRGRPPANKKDSQGPSPSPKEPEPKKKRDRSKAKSKDPKPGVYKKGQWHLGNDGNAYDLDNTKIEAPGMKYMFQSERGTLAKKEEEYH